MKRTATIAAALACMLVGPATGWADNHGNGNDQNSGDSCSGLPNQAQLKSALAAAVSTENTGLNLNMWATIVDRDGIVCAVAFSGTDRGAQWPGSRAISAQKANTANAFSLDKSAASGAAANGLALSTANLYSAVQPGGSLYGLQASNPVDTGVAYMGPSKNYGTPNDPMVGEKIGGVNVFGGGFALYGPGHKILGAVGVSGDTSCADHRIGWRTRHGLGLDHMGGSPSVSGVSGDAARPDNMLFDITGGVSASGFGHPHCLGAATDGDPATLPAVIP